jgi:hypothetical protein
MKLTTPGAHWLLALLLMSLAGWNLVVAPTLPTDTAQASLAGCPVLPANNIWNQPVTNLPVHPHSAEYIQSIGANSGLHADFGAGLWDGGPIGIPYNLVTSSQPKSAVTFVYDDESDAGPYPLPANPLIEGGPNSSGDRHILIIDTDACILYELYSAYPPKNGAGWQAGSGAIYDLNSNALRPAGWTSADAAGLPILPGLVRYDEVASGQIRHALRFTVSQTQRAYVWPARHFASSQTAQSLPPMGMRFRLKASFDTSQYSGQARVILEALKTYGMILADNGSNWYISGVPDERWDNDILHSLGGVLGSSFEAVDTSGLMVYPDSGMVFKAPGEHAMWLPLVCH